MEVTIYMADFAGHVYTYSYGIVEDFDREALCMWVVRQTSHDGLLPYDEGLINVSACSRIWYETWEEH